MEPQQPSVYNEERNILRLRAWEQRIQETGQARDPNTESVPLFGQPYKTNKGDELSTRIQRMFGNYEDVNYPHPVAMEPLSIPSYVTFPQSEQRLTHTDKTTQPSFHNQNMSNQSQKAPLRSSYPSQPTRPSAAPSSPNPCGHLSSFSPHQIKKRESCSDHREQEMSSLSADVKPPPYLLSADGENTDMDTKVTFDRQLQGSTDDPSESACTVDVSSYHLKQSPKDAPQPQVNKGNALPSQMFPSLLSSKQPSVVMTQKPTAYVRPMDGQDQVVSESPELKPSPEPYVPLPELISKSDEGKRKTLPNYLETRKNEAQCVEDILKEMTHAWPPLLPAIHTPGPAEPSKSPFQTKEEEHVSSCPGQKNHVASSDPSQPNQQSSTSSSQAAHSRGAESTSSSDSESSSRSESDSESTTEEPPKPPVSNPVKEEPNAPAITHDSWQLGHFIRSSSKPESQNITQASDRPAQKQPPSTQSTKHSAVEEVNPTKESKPQVSPHRKESAESLGKVQVCRESPQDNYNQLSSQKSLPADQKSCSSVRKLSSNTNSSKSAKTHNTEAALDVKSEDVVATWDKDRQKVKKKAGHSRKSKGSSDAKRDVERTPKHTSLDKRKAESEPDVTVTPHPRCQTCGVQYPNSCTCPSQNPASLGPSIGIKQESKTICQKGTKNSHKSSQGHLGKTGNEAKSTCGPPQSLLVSIDLSLLSRVPQKPNSHQDTHSKSKRSVVVTEQDGGGGDADTTHKVGITSKKRVPQNVEVGNKDVPRKKRKLENSNTSSSHPSVKPESCSKSTEGSKQKKAKKNPSPQPVKSKTSVKKTRSPEAMSEESSKKTVNGKDSRKNKRGSEKHTERSHPEKKLPKSSDVLTSQSTRKAVPQRPLLQVEHRQYPVKHYIKEAQKLKHKADAESDKMNKAFNYLEAAMYFVESGIAMEKDPQISTSSHTMFAETVELLKFVLKLKNSVDPSTPPKEKDFLALGLKCQSLLQMAMFRHKQKTALKYSKTLTDHFNISSQKTPDPSASASKSSNTPSPAPNLPSPANISTSSGSVVDPLSSTVAVPQAIEQVAFTYVNITTLFLSAQDIWEQAEELAHRGSGLLKELDTVMGPLSLTSSMSSMVRYTRQGVHWLRLDSLKVATSWPGLLMEAHEEVSKAVVPGVST